MPHPSHRPTSETRAEVEALASFGAPQDDIAAYVGISTPTLAKHYGRELKLGSIKANDAVGRFLFSLASGAAMAHGATHGDCRTAAIFWAKTRMGWRETARHEHTGADGGPIETADAAERVKAKLLRLFERHAEDDDDGAFSDDAPAAGA